MFRLDNLLESWAVIYTPLSHNLSAAAKPQDKSFFRIDRLDVENEWTRNQNLIQHPCMLFNTQIEAELDKNHPKHASYAHGFFLAVRQQSVNNAANDNDAADCKLQLDEMVLDLVAFLFITQEYVEGISLPKNTPDDVRQLLLTLSTDDKRYIRGWQLDGLRWWTTPRYLQGWWLVGIEFDSLDPRPLCLSPSKYGVLPDDDSSD